MYPIAARTSSIAHARSDGVLLNELATEIFEWRSHYLARTEMGYFRSDQYGPLIQTYNDTARYRFTQLLEWDPVECIYVYVPHAQSLYRPLSNLQTEAMESYHLSIVRTDFDRVWIPSFEFLRDRNDELINEKDENVEGMSSKQSMQPSLDNDYGIEEDSCLDNNETLFQSKLTVISQTEVELKHVLGLLNKKLFGMSQASTFMISESTALFEFIHSLKNISTDVDYIIDRLVSLMDECSLVEGMDTIVWVQFVFIVFSVIIMFPEAVLRNKHMEQLIEKGLNGLWMSLNQQNNDGSVTPQNIAFNRIYVVKDKEKLGIDEKAFTTIISDLVTLLFCIKVNQQCLKLFRNESNTPANFICGFSYFALTLSDNSRDNEEVKDLNPDERIESSPFHDFLTTFDKYLNLDVALVATLKSHHRSDSTIDLLLHRLISIAERKSRFFAASHFMMEYCTNSKTSRNSAKRQTHPMESGRSHFGITK